jgi:acyl-CoA reductase-like NAD-dependent aldehyde dehydrogenase
MASNGAKSHISNDAFGHVVPLLINGKEITTETTFDVTSPITNKVIWKSSSVSKDDAIKAVEAAQAAFPAWSKTKPSKRRDILLKASDILAQRAEEAAEYMEIETGAVPAYSGGFNVPSAIEQLRDVAGRIITSTGHIPICGEEGKSAMIIKEPYGVIFGIAPWFVLCYLRILWKFLTIDQECTVHSGLPRCILCARCGQHLRPQRP